jgi:hypothetical protein
VPEGRRFSSSPVDAGSLSVTPTAIPNIKKKADIPFKITFEKQQTSLLLALPRFAICSYGRSAF